MRITITKTIVIHYKYLGLYGVQCTGREFLNFSEILGKI